MRCALLMVALAAFPAAADTTYIVSVSNRVTRIQPSATVEVWAVFDANLYAFAGAMLDVHASPDSGGFSDPHRLLSGPGTRDGDLAPDGDSVSDIIAGQLHCPIEFCNDTSNPILIWQVTWSTEDFSARTVDLWTDTARFDVYIDKDGTSKGFIDELVEGSGLIEVGCYADCTNDGSLDLFDFLCFVNQFNAGAHSADCDGSGTLDLFDFLCFVNAFNAGC